MEHRRHIRLVVVPAQAVVLPGHAAAATEKRKDRWCVFSPLSSEWLSRRVDGFIGEVIGDGDPKRHDERERERDSLFPSSPSVPPRLFPKPR